jgi:catechol 2,3-dioxygenase-like lactoylglutathione lyase family enzyme
MTMIDHLSVSVADPARSAAFYDAALAPLGYVRAMEFEAPDGSFKGIAYGPAGGKPYFWIGGPALGGAAVTPMAGFHVAFAAAGRAAVDAFHAAALGAGGADNGAPGLRPHYHPHYYAAFVIDPDGHHVEAVCHKPQHD